MKTNVKVLITNLALAVAITMAQGPASGAAAGQRFDSGAGNGAMPGKAKQSGQVQIDQS